MAAGETTKDVREAGQDFIRDIVAGDLAAGRVSEVVTRFPPEPNGYLHIGHAKSICLNFGIAEEFGGRCHLRFDDTNPVKEEQEYIDAIKHDVAWLGFDWGEHLYYASDYFEQLYAWAEHLIESADAYVDDQSQEEMRARRGTLTEPGIDSPFRNRSVAENLDLFRRMRAGEFANGVTRAARENRHGGGQYQSARSGALPHPSCRPSAHRHDMVHLPELRFRPWPVGCDRGNHPFHLHAGIRGSPAALRLVPRQAAGAVAPAPV